MAKKPLFGKGFAQRLARAKVDHGLESFGQLLEEFQGWLFILARLESDGRLQAKLEPQDLVQETLLRACRARAKFRGRTAKELAGWLRSILAHVIARELRRWQGSKMRDVSLEASIGGSLERSSACLRNPLAAEGPSPSERALAEEECFFVAQAIAQLPNDYREVILLRGLKGLPYDDVAARMERSPGAVRVLWLRALARLREEVEPWSR